MTTSAQVPDEGELQLGTVTLPAGRWLRSKGGDGDPVAWMTEALVPEPGPAWSALSELHAQTGLVPILEPAIRSGGLTYLQYSCRETATIADVDETDPAALLEHRWTDCFPEAWQTGPDWDEERQWAEDMAAPFTSQYPGLAPAMHRTLEPAVLQATLRAFPPSRIALIPAERPADVLTVLGWCPGNAPTWYFWWD
jgi:hypothetical protein